MLGSYYIDQGMDIRGLIRKVEEVIPFIAERERILHRSPLSYFQVYADNWRRKVLTVKRRTKDIKFAVGMIRRHKRYEYTCVVYGWGLMPSQKNDWIHEFIRVPPEEQQQQPFYNVLVQDGSVRCVAQGRSCYFVILYAILNPKT